MKSVVIPIVNENTLKFNCTQCGACCRALNCQYLTKDNLCSIYEQRPLICNIDKGYEVWFKDLMSKEEFYKLNEKHCKTLQEQEK
jgi:Fe-S-cluster containining protein